MLLNYVNFTVRIELLTLLARMSCYQATTRVCDTFVCKKKYPFLLIQARMGRRVGGNLLNSFLTISLQAYFD